MPIVLRDEQGRGYIACVIGRADKGRERSMSHDDIQRIFDEVSVHGRREVNAVRVPDEHGWTAYLIFNTKMNEKISISKVIHLIKTGNIEEIDDDRDKIAQAVESAVEGGWSGSHHDALDPDMHALTLLASWFRLVPEGVSFDELSLRPSITVETRQTLSPSVTEIFGTVVGPHEDHSTFVEMQVLERINNLPAVVMVDRVLALSRILLDDQR